MDTPIGFTLISLRDFKAPDRGYGEKFEVHLKHRDSGTDVTWELDEKQINRIFKNEYKGKIEWEAKDGEDVDVMYCTSKSGGRDYYNAVPSDGSTPEPAKREVVKPASVPSPERTVEWGGTPRQASFRSGLLLATNGLIIASGKPVLTDEIKQEAADLFLWSREKADELEKTYPNH